jgi:hypothetical protein
MGEKILIKIWSRSLRSTWALPDSGLHYAVPYAAGPYSSEACCLGLYLTVHWMPVITQLWMNLN